MITEFLGVSGVGKTTLAHRYVEERPGDCPKVYQFETLYRKHGWLARNLIKSGSIVRFGMVHTRWVWKLAAFLRESEVPLRDFSTSLWNGTFLKASLLDLSPDREFVYDEGVYQFLWSVFLRGGTCPAKSLVQKHEALFGTPSKLVVVTAPPQKIESRLLKRNEYCRIMSAGSNLVEYITRMQTVMLAMLDFIDSGVSVEFIKN